MNSTDREWVIRCWEPDDDAQLRTLMKRQHDIDPKWPPAYAHTLDFAEWLAKPATLGRWVAERDGVLVGHAGLGVVSPDHSGHYSSFLDCAEREIAVICRMVVDPDHRSGGLAADLTRKALRRAIESGKHPVAEVLTGRGSWLDMMLATGWQEIVRTDGQQGTEPLVLLAAPERFNKLVRNNG